MGIVSMAKSLTIMAMAVAILIFLVFALDLAIGYPFRRARITMDIVFIICSLALAYISWNAMRDLK